MKFCCILTKVAESDTVSFRLVGFLTFYILWSVIILVCIAKVLGINNDKEISSMQQFYGADCTILNAYLTAEVEDQRIAVTCIVAEYPRVIQCSQNVVDLQIFYENTVDDDIPPTIILMGNCYQLRSLLISGEYKPFIKFNNTVLPQLEKVFITKSILKKPDWDALIQYKKLSTLMIDNSNITNIESIIFNPCWNLTTLSLARNNIENLSILIFFGCTNMKRLDLSHNQLSKLPAKLFTGLVALQILDVNSNRIAHLENKVFTGLSNIKVINLSHNHITTIGNTLQGLFEAHIDLSNNQINKLDKYAFNLTSNLSVNLANNKITGFSKNKLKFVTQLCLGDGTMSCGNTTFNIPFCLKQYEITFIRKKCPKLKHLSVTVNTKVYTTKFEANTSTKFEMNISAKFKEHTLAEFTAYNTSLDTPTWEEKQLLILATKNPFSQIIIIILSCILLIMICLFSITLWFVTKLRNKLSRINLTKSHKGRFAALVTLTSINKHDNQKTML